MMTSALRPDEMDVWRQKKIKRTVNDEDHPYDRKTGKHGLSPGLPDWRSVVVWQDILNLLPKL